MEAHQSAPWTRLVSVLAGGISALLGMVVLVGWYTHTETLVQVLPTFVPMQYNTALGFLLCGSSMLAVNVGRIRTTLATATLALAIGFLTLVEYVLAVNLGIDQLLMEHYITVATSHPGRMAPNTALCFLLGGVALSLAVRKDRGFRYTLVLGLIGSIIVGLGTIALFGYLGGVETAYGWGRLTRMAVHTAFGFGVLGTGMFALAWSKAVDQTGATPRWLPIPIGVGMLTITLTLWQALHAAMNDASSALPEVALAAGTLLALLLMLTIYLAQTARDRARAMQRANEELKKQQEALLESQVFNEILLNSSPDIIYIYDIVDQTNVYSNEGIKKVLGYSVKEIQDLGEHVIPTLMHPDDFVIYLNEILPRYQEANDDEWIEHEYRMKHKDGTWHWLRSKESIFKRRADGIPKQIFGVINDITEPKKAEEALKESEKQLSLI